MIHTYDHTTTDDMYAKAQPEKGFHIYRKGIALTESEQMTTLEAELNKHRNENRTIKMIKVNCLLVFLMPVQTGLIYTQWG